MNQKQTIHIDTELDLISARMRVRNLARSLGFNPPDQARISLATSSLFPIQAVTTCIGKSAASSVSRLARMFWKVFGQGFRPARLMIRLA